MIGAPGLCEAWLLAATYIQWLKAWVVIGLPATSATEFPGTPLPHAATPPTTTKKAPSARILPRYFFMRAADGSEALVREGEESARAPQPSPCRADSIA